MQTRNNYSKSDILRIVCIVLWETLPIATVVSLFFALVVMAENAIPISSLLYTWAGAIVGFCAHFVVKLYNERGNIEKS